MTYRELDEAVTNAGSALKATINAGKGTSIGMYAANSSEWMISMKAVDFCGGMTVCFLLYCTPPYMGHCCQRAPRVACTNSFTRYLHPQKSSA